MAIVDSPPITIILTGGTLDKIYHPEKGELGFEGSIVPELLKDSRVGHEISFEQPFLMDSLDMSDEHRQSLLELGRRVQTSHILITHGTDTMVETAIYLQKGLKGADKVVTLTGAMVPARLPHSDALFNLGFALGQLPHQPRGVHIAMNGRVFAPDDCQKNKNKGVFEKPRAEPSP